MKFETQNPLQIKTPEGKILQKFDTKITK